MAIEIESLRGRPPKTDVDIMVVRELSIDDLPALREIVPVPPPAPLTTLRSSHHQIAQLLAKGMDSEKVSLITGYSVVYVNRLKNQDPAFQELLSYYGTERELIFVDTIKRMNDVGNMALDVLQERLVEQPEGFANRELMEVTETLLIKGRPAVMAQSASGGEKASGPANLTIRFVSGESGEAIRGPIIEGEIIGENE